MPNQNSPNAKQKRTVIYNALIKYPETPTVEISEIIFRENPGLWKSANSPRVTINISRSPGKEFHWQTGSRALIQAQHDARHPGGIDTYANNPIAGLKRSAIHDSLVKYPALSASRISRMLYKDNPGLWNSRGAILSAICHARGGASCPGVRGFNGKFFWQKESHALKLAQVQSFIDSGRNSAGRNGEVIGLKNRSAVGNVFLDIIKRFPDAPLASIVRIALKDELVINKLINMASTAKSYYDKFIRPKLKTDENKTTTAPRPAARLPRRGRPAQELVPFPDRPSEDANPVGYSPALPSQACFDNFTGSRQEGLD